MKAARITTRSVKAELRANLLDRLRTGAPLFPGILGYDRTVLPLVENALLSRHDMIFLGERGQAKTRLIRALTGLLDPAIPAVEHCPLHDDPYAPLCKACRDRAEALGDDLPVVWIEAEERYGEKLATPDVTIGDLIGDIDPIRVAEGRHLSDEEVMHFGLVPRVHRGIFALNELPDLPEKVQVGLFNLMEERDIQIRGFRVRLPVDVCVVATANPEDYTNRGRIITPLKDRFQAQIRTHYPRDRATEIAILEQEVVRNGTPGIEIVVPSFLKSVVAEMTMRARRHADINQQSGVSVRMSIDNTETLIGCAEKRAARLGESAGCPRLTDLPALLSTSSGKIELEGLGDETQERQIIEHLEHEAIRTVFAESVGLEPLADVIAAFDAGATMRVGDTVPTAEYAGQAARVPGLSPVAERLAEGAAAALPVAIEFVCEGLYHEGRVRRETLENGVQYRA